MSERVSFSVPCVAVKERPRRGKNGNWYTPKKTEADETTVAWYARKARRRFAGPVRVTLAFYTDRPADVDNAIKGTLDGLQNGQLFADDSQVRAIAAEMRPADEHGERTLILVEPFISTDAVRALP